MIEIEVNGKKVLAEDGSTIIEAADSADIFIPRFCYHPKLSVAANCRMCLVEVANMRKPVPACATPVTAGMQVFTKSKKTRDAQTSVMEYLLVNHPLDCPICDQGGECELQDTSMGYGFGESNYIESKRSVFSEDIGPLIDTGMTRCIHCTRCVRFGDEVAGLRELGVCDRGENSEVGTYIPHFINSEVSGNVIDLCPVGALTSKPFKYQARSWEMREHAGIGMHDCWGSNLFWHVSRDDNVTDPKVMRVVPRTNEGVNENWLSDRDRFSYTGMQHKDRLLHPKVKRADQWQTQTWQKLLPECIDAIKKVINEHGAESVAVITSPNITNESGFATLEVMRALGINNFDHRLHMQDFSSYTNNQDLFGAAFAIPDIEQADRFLLLGCSIKQELPLAALRMRKAVAEGAKVSVISSEEYSSNVNLAQQVTLHPDLWLQHLCGILQAALDNGADLSGHALPDWAKNKTPESDQIECAKTLMAGINKMLWLGSGVYRHPQAGKLIYIAKLLASAIGAKIAIVPDGANSIGLSKVGILPQAGDDACKDLRSMFDGACKCFILIGFDPEHDLSLSGLADAAFVNSDLIVSLNSFSSNYLDSIATYQFPITCLPEESGSMLNITGFCQSFTAAVDAPKDAKPVWKVMRQIARLVDFNQSMLDKLQNVDAIFENLQVHLTKKESSDRQDYSSSFTDSDITNNYKLWRIGAWPIYMIDQVVRRSEALQQTQAKLLDTDVAMIHPETAQQLNLEGKISLEANGQSREFVLQVDSGVAKGCVQLASGTEQVSAWSCAEGPIELGGNNAS